MWRALPMHAEEVIHQRLDLNRRRDRSVLSRCSIKLASSARFAQSLQQQQSLHGAPSSHVAVPLTGLFSDDFFHSSLYTSCDVAIVKYDIRFYFLRESYRRRKMYCGHARLCVCVCVRGRTPTLLHGLGCNSGGVVEAVQ